MKRVYYKPVIEIIKVMMESDTCVPVYFSNAGPGTAGAKQAEFEEEEEEESMWSENYSVWE